MNKYREQQKKIKEEKMQKVGKLYAKSSFHNEAILPVISIDFERGLVVVDCEQRCIEKLSDIALISLQK